MKKLLTVGFIEEAKFLEWLENVVVVKKVNEKWRMYVDYTDLNKDCSKDHYPLPNINQLTNVTDGYSMLSFLGAFSEYHQIAMIEKDILKTPFITHNGTYLYIKMSFGMLNAGATYKRMINKIFANQIMRNMECYVDDMIVKNIDHSHVPDLRKCFQPLRKH